MDEAGLLAALVVAVIVLIATAGKPSKRQIQQEQQTWDDRVVLDHVAQNHPEVEE